AGQVESILHVGPAGVLQSLYYTYDDDGQRTKIEREDGTRIYYSYDAAHRLTGEDWLDQSDSHIYGFAYQYDAAGNRLRKTFNGEVTYYDYNNLNQLTTERVLGGEATYYTWTADGAMATKQDVAGWTYYTWDVDESLKKIETPNVSLDNKYNARMQRVWRNEDGEAEWLVYDAQKLVAEAASTSLNRYYLSEGGWMSAPLTAQLAGLVDWYLADASGSTVGMLNGMGDVVDSILYDHSGQIMSRSGTVSTPFLDMGGRGYFHEGVLGGALVWGVAYSAGLAMPLNAAWSRLGGDHFFVLGVEVYDYSGPRPPCPCGWIETRDIETYTADTIALIDAMQAPKLGARYGYLELYECKFEMYKVTHVTGTELCVTKSGVKWRRKLNKVYRRKTGSKHQRLSVHNEKLQYRHDDALDPLGTGAAWEACQDWLRRNHGRYIIDDITTAGPKR
ncbi:MAG: hypothetical protein ABFE08_23590, partial [Armatimonadia bacterium]